jgi:hypothetical protein
MMSSQGINGSQGGWVWIALYALIGIPLYAYACAMMVRTGPCRYYLLPA